VLERARRPQRCGCCGEFAGRSEVITALAAAFLKSLGPQDPATVERRARRLVRVLTSLLMFPGPT